MQNQIKIFKKYINPLTKIHFKWQKNRDNLKKYKYIHAIGLEFESTKL